MAARWPYGVALILVVAAMGAHAFAPFAGLGYSALLPLGAITWYAVTRRSPFRGALIAADLMLVAGLTIMVTMAPLGLAIVNRGMFVAEEALSLVGFLAILAIPVPAILTGIIGLMGGMARPGVRQEHAPFEPVGSIG
jgi:hypothetical protein